MIYGREAMIVNNYLQLRIHWDQIIKRSRHCSLHLQILLSFL